MLQSIDGQADISVRACCVVHAASVTIHVGVGTMTVKHRFGTIAACKSTTIMCMQMGDHGVSGQYKYQLEEAQRAEKRVSPHMYLGSRCL